MGRVWTVTRSGTICSMDSNRVTRLLMFELGNKVGMEGRANAKENKIITLICKKEMKRKQKTIYPALQRCMTTCQKIKNNAEVH